MQAPLAQASSIKINFGEKHQSTTPLDFSLILDFFSPEQQSIRSTLTNNYKVSLPKTCFAFEFIPDNGSAQQAAQRLSKIQQQFKIHKQVQNKFSTHHHQNRVLCILQLPQFAQSLQTIQQHFSQLKVDAQTQKHQITLRLTSHNDLAIIGEKIKKNGELAWLDSLDLEFGFIKTDLITRFMIIFLQQVMGLESLSSMLRSFKKLNIQLNLASSDYLNLFPKLQRLQVQERPHNDFSLFFQHSGMEKGRFFAFNPTLFLKGNLTAIGLLTILKLFYK